VELKKRKILSKGVPSIITISGTGFNASNFVYIGSTLCNITSFNENEIICSPGNKYKLCLFKINAKAL
jgi:hypothetical protein